MLVRDNFAVLVDGLHAELLTNEAVPIAIASPAWLILVVARRLFHLHFAANFEVGDFLLGALRHQAHVAFGRASSSYLVLN